MSGIYIKGMDMPKSCAKCKLYCGAENRITADPADKEEEG